MKMPEPINDTEIKSTVDNDWLDRNAASTSSAYQNVPTTLSTASTSSYGLSNLNLKSYTNASYMESNVEAKFHTGDVSDSDYVEIQKEKKQEILPIVKKRKLSR